MRGAKAVLITGASGGIGRELALAFARRGHAIVAAGRDRERLDALAGEIWRACGTRVVTAQCDLVEPDAPQWLIERAAADDLQIEVLVNNAGVIDLGAFAEIDAARLQGLLQLNVVAATTLTRLALPAMLARGSGRILNVASVAAFAPTPALAAYGAAKAFMLSLTEALSVELQGTGVSATVVCPRSTDTPMLDGVRRDSPDADAMMGWLGPADPREVAEAAYEACMRGDVVCTPGSVGPMAEYLLRIQPRWLVRTLWGSIGRRYL